MGLCDPAPSMTSQSGNVAQRSWAAAILGEAGVHLEEGVAKELLPLIGPALARSSAHDPDPEVRSNTLCSIGRLAANGVALGAYPWRQAPPTSHATQLAPWIGPKWPNFTHMDEPSSCSAHP